MSSRDLPLPTHYDARAVARWDYEPDVSGLMAAARDHASRHGITPAGEDATKTLLLVVDAQRDFCLPRGSLFVGGRSGTGAIDDNDRLCRFLYRNLESITDTCFTLDTHLPFQIFFPSFWVRRDGSHPPAHCEVRADEVASGEFRINPAIAWWLRNGDLEWLQRQVEFYCRELERGGRYRLYLWPPHCLLGSGGHALVGAVQEARLFHAFARAGRAWLETKGTLALTEHYSALRPEVLNCFDGEPLAKASSRFYEVLLAYDRVVIAGQAASHCVRYTLDDLVAEFQARNPEFVSRLVVLEDCMSAVTVADPDHPGELKVDFTPQVDEALARWRAMGLRVMRSEDALPRATPREMAGGLPVR